MQTAINQTTITPAAPLKTTLRANTWLLMFSGCALFWLAVGTLAFIKLA